MIARLSLLFVMAMVPHLARGQNPQPEVHVSIEPARVVVGQPARLRVEVLAPNYMTAPPDLPDFQVRNAVTRPLQSINLSERRGETTYAGVRFEFALYPQEPGSFAVGNEAITVHFAAEPPKSTTATLSLPRILFDAFIPDAASALNPFISATSLSIEQQVERSSDALKVGDSLTRIVTLKAQGMPAMLLPPVAFPAIDGLALYPAQPSLQDAVDRRSDILSATRVDAATYMLEKAGDYRLPAIELRWWNVGTGKVDTARLDAVDLHVAENPDALRAPPSEAERRRGWQSLVDQAVRHWPAMLAAGALLVVLCWLLPPATRRFVAGCKRWRAAWLASEQRAFVRLLTAACGRDARRFYFALLGWTARLGSGVTVKSVCTAAQSEPFDRRIAAIKARLFATKAGHFGLPSARLLIGLVAARRRLRAHAAMRPRANGLPRTLNPGPLTVPPARWRPVAR
jgi:hypothetical protein